MQENWCSDRLKTIDDFFFKKHISVTLDFDLNFREGRFGRPFTGLASSLTERRRAFSLAPEEDVGSAS